MPVVEVNDLDSLGQINDVAAYQLAPEAWTLVENMRFETGGVAVMLGWTQIFGTPQWAPHFALPVKTAAQTYWLYTSLTKAGAFDGNTHADITRAAGGDYATNATQNWNGVVFGGIPIFNNGVDVPQYWASYSLATKLAALPNWTSTLRAQILRNFGSYLVAFNITDTGVNYPHLVQWSNPASPGSVPTSWAYSNPATEGGRKDLPDVNSGFIREAMQLGTFMMIYKERSIWKMSYIGGQFIFQFDPFLTDVGILSARCVCMDGSGQRHVVVTQDDIITHNGNSVESVLTDRQKKTLFDSINREAADTSFIFLNRAKDEVWFCYPESGQTSPSRALIWNYKKGKGAISFASGLTFRNAIVGDVEGTSAELWSDGTDTWEDDTGPWSVINRNRVVLSSPVNTKFYLLDSGVTRDGSSFVPVLRREDLGIIGRTRTGAAVNDFKQMKMVDSLWPKVNSLGSIKIRVGFKETVPGALTWQDYTVFNPQTDVWINTIVNESLPGCGRSVAVEFTNIDSSAWRIDGYSMNVEVIGAY